MPKATTGGGRKAPTTTVKKAQEPVYFGNWTRTELRGIFKARQSVVHDSTIFRSMREIDAHLNPQAEDDEEEYSDEFPVEEEDEEDDDEENEREEAEEG